MKARKLLVRAADVLELRRELVRRRRKELKEAVLDHAGLRSAVAQESLAVAEVHSKIAKLRSARPTLPSMSDPKKRIAEQGEEVLAKQAVRQKVTEAIQQALRQSAAQASLDRAQFTRQMKETLPQELWADTLNTYDRAIFESSHRGVR